jgi:hypothetical protein
LYPGRETNDFCAIEKKSPMATILLSQMTVIIKKKSRIVSWREWIQVWYI